MALATFFRLGTFFSQDHTVTGTAWPPNRKLETTFLLLKSGLRAQRQRSWGAGLAIAFHAAVLTSSGASPCLSSPTTGTTSARDVSSCSRPSVCCAHSPRAENPYCIEAPHTGQQTLPHPCSDPSDPTSRGEPCSMFKVFEMPFPTAVLWEKPYWAKPIQDIRQGLAVASLKLMLFYTLHRKAMAWALLGGLRNKGYCRELRLVLRGEGKKYGKESGVGQLFTGKSDRRAKPLVVVIRSPGQAHGMKTQTAWLD
ncbi:hypothetical protein HJG60_009351 [Phyllostomus discolor]|uniref:Uncharacterized protein n=1 Tax=Phyllostomus discolor TaxID=89673 RepID=A0A833YL69_9CHIR|nr:hypothetical protein HJG60_009351 [Phyllostomus discolor]